MSLVYIIEPTRFAVSANFLKNCIISPQCWISSNLCKLSAKMYNKLVSNAHQLFWQRKEKFI